jgi:cell division protein FtsB
MRKLIYFIMVFILITSLVGCSNFKNESQKTNKTTTNEKDIEGLKQQINKLNTDYSNLKLVNTQLESENSTLKENIDEFNMPKEIRPDIPLDWKVYRYLQYGYEVAYPENYYASISGGHSPAANPELEMRLSLSTKDNSQPWVDIDSIGKTNYKDKYQNVEDYIKYKFQDGIVFDENIIVNNHINKIYKMKDDNYYFSFIENRSFIFEFSCSSKEILQKIMNTFIFI